VESLRFCVYGPRVRAWRSRSAKIEGEKIMRVDEIKFVLKRKPISPGQLALFKVLYHANQPLTLNSIAYMMRGGHLDELIGVLGALTNRIMLTEGVEDLPDPAYLALFDVEIVNGLEHFTMRPELREAIEKLPPLRKIIEKFTVDEIYQRYQHGEAHWLDLAD
jgi:hypothetical protein